MCMSCYFPLSGFLVDNFIDSNKQKLIIKPYKTLTCFYAGKRLTRWIPIPCGKCLGCKMEYAQSWSVRLQLEASLYPDELNHFITLTYRNECNPVTLVKRDVQLFIKRLRASLGECRFFLCGEYGSLGRPHYHLILFNCKIDDLEPYSKLNPNGLYISKTLDNLWKFGNVIIGKCTPQSIGYTARYCVKKAGEDIRNKELKSKVGLLPEFLLMSRRPGIGAGAFRKEWFEWNYIPLNGRKYPINRFYIDMFKSLGYDYSVINDYMQNLIQIDLSRYGSMDNYFKELENKSISDNERLKILKERNLNQYGID